MSKPSPITIGTRVVAVSHNEGNKLFVFGRGIFEGYFLPPHVNVAESITEIQTEYAAARLVTPDLPDGFTVEEATKAIILSESNPRIRLTETLDGQPLDEVVWGYECWWSNEEEFNAKSAGRYEFVTKTVAEYRAEVEKMAAMEAELKAAVMSAVAPRGGVIEEN